MLWAKNLEHALGESSVAVSRDYPDFISTPRHHPFTSSPPYLESHLESQRQPNIFRKIFASIMSNATPSFGVLPQTPRRQMRHRSSLEHILSFTLLSPLPAQHDIDEATFLYHRILDDCEAAGAVLRKPPGDADNVRADQRDQQEHAFAGADLELENLSDYDGDDGNDDNDDDLPSDGAVPLHKLFRAIIDYCPTVEGCANVVRIVLHGLFPVDDYQNPQQRALTSILPRARRWISFTAIEKEHVYRTLALFADDFLQGFFVPLKAQGRCTPAVSTLITPTSRSEVGPDQGVTTRLGTLRRRCLARDGGRCVMTRTYDNRYLETLYAGLPPRRRRHMPAGGKTEAAHIIPHSLNSLHADATILHPSKRMVWRILNMFAPGVSNSLAGDLIDTPMNAMMLTADIHERFGNLDCYLQQTSEANTYTFHMVRGKAPLVPSATPTEKIVFTNHDQEPFADLPSPRLLAIHRACCMMLSMSGAAEYVENLLDDTETLMERGVLAEDGSSNFALVMKLRGLQEGFGEWESFQEPVVVG